METIPSQPKTPEAGESYVHKRYKQLIILNNSIDETLKYLGGEEGLNELLGSGLPPEKIKEIREIIQQKIIERQKYILKYGKDDNIIDTMWELGSLANPLEYRDGGMQGDVSKLTYPLFAFWGLMSAGAAAPFKGIQHMARKIELGIQKRTLGKI